MSSMQVSLFPEDSSLLDKRFISLPKLILHWAVGRPNLNIIPPSDVRSIIKNKRHPRQGNTSITEQHLAEMIRDQDIRGEWWAEWYRDPPLAQPHSHTRVRKEKRKKILVRYPLLSGFFGLVSKREPALENHAPEVLKFNPMFDMCIR